MNDKDKKIIDNTIDILIKSAAVNITDEMFDEIEGSLNENEILFSDRHIREMNKILSYEGYTAKKINKRILLVAVIVMIITLIAALSVGADRLRFSNYFMNINKRDTEFRSDDKIYEDEYSLSRANEKKYKVILKYIPDNFVFDFEEDTDSNYTASYKSNDKYFTVMKSILPDSWGVDTENAKTKYININGSKAFFSSKSEIKILTWVSNNILHQIAGNIDEETIIKIAENME